MSDHRCRECGGPAPVRELLGNVIKAPYCDGCAPVAAARDEALERTRTLDEALACAGATAKLRRWTIDTYPRDEHTEKALAVGRSWLAGYRAGAHRNLLLVGEYGTTKTGLAWSLARELVEEAVTAFYATPLERRPIEPHALALFVAWRPLLSDLRDSFRREQRAAVAGDVTDPLLVLERARRVPLLVLDDLGSERPSAFAVEALATLIEHRWQGERPMIVTSNYGSKELAARLGQEEPVMGQRIVSRLIDDAAAFRFDGPNRRRLAQ